MGVKPWYTFFSISIFVTYFSVMDGVRVATYADSTPFSIANIMKVLVIKDIEYFLIFFMNCLTTRKSIVT